MWASGSGWMTGSEQAEGWPQWEGKVLSSWSSGSDCSRERESDLRGRRETQKGAVSCE